MYIEVASLSFQSQMEYKMNFLLSFLFKLVPFIVNIFVWLSVTTVGKFSMSRNEIVSYYIINLITSNMLICSIQYEISNDIRNGTIGKYLIKPVNYLGYQFMKDMPSRLIFLYLGAIPSAVVIYFMRNFIEFHFSVIYLCLYIVSLIIGYVINFLLCFLISELSFYFTNVSSFFTTTDVIKDIISGAIFPLSLLPDAIANGLIFLPFSYVGYIPTVIMLQEYSVNTICIQLLLGGGWCLLLGALCKVTWSNGLKKYAVFGG